MAHDTPPLPPPSTSTVPTTVPPSVDGHRAALLGGHSYTHHSPIPRLVTPNASPNAPPNATPNATPNAADSSPSTGTPCVLGVDEAGRGPVLGPMIYGVFYLPIELHHSLLAATHRFDDSKVLTPAVRAGLVQTVCTEGTDLHDSCGWAIRSLSARDIGAGMLKKGASYNLNAQAMDATISLIREVVDRGVNVSEVYVDTIGSPSVYQKRLERVFPTIKITVEKKADSLYPCVSAASVMAKVTRDVSCELLEEEWRKSAVAEQEREKCHQSAVAEQDAAGWGSGYPSDARCVAWLKQSAHPLFGWGNECRFSWATVKDMLEANAGPGLRADWPSAEEEADTPTLARFFDPSAPKAEADELRTWFGAPVGQDVF
ncbi:hypothetical protein DV737_g5446, partial [Chaetothyriales sp. CBS 132003]